ncbi:MAG: hypothetical protein WCI43_09895, partial [Candidatus Firestonebacteria bacterium]
FSIVSIEMIASPTQIQPLHVYRKLKSATFPYYLPYTILEGKHMILKKEEFAKSLMYLAPDVDIQPLLRFSNLTDTFVYVNLFLDEKEAMSGLEEKVNRLEGKLKITGFGKKFSDKDLDIDESAFKLEAIESSWMTSEEKRNYRRELFPATAREEWGREIFLERIIGSTKRKLRLLYFTGEALASYLAMSHIGKYPPKYVCTVQSISLEVPGGIFEKMIQYHKHKPLIWTRGFEPSDYRFWDKFKRTDSKALEENGLYSFKAQTYARWMGHDDSLRHVASFSKEKEPVKNTATIKEFTGNNRKVKLARGLITQEDFASFDLVFISKNAAKSIVGFKKTGKVVLWEEAEWWYQNCTLKQILELVSKKALEKKASKVLMHPAGFEDEGVYYKEWVSDKSVAGPEYLEVRFTDPLDYVDVMAK